MIEFEYSRDADALYVRFSDAVVAYSQDVSHAGYYQRGIDYADDGTPIGVEFLGVSQGIDLTDIPHADKIADQLGTYKIRRVA